MGIFSFDDVDDLFAEMQRDQQEADAGVKPWQAEIKPGDYVARLGRGCFVYSEILPDPEPRDGGMEHYRFTRSYSVFCPKGELGLVFPAPNGQVENHTNIYRNFASIQKRCGILDQDGKTKYGVHALRHFFASWAIDQEFSIKKIQALLGHQSITMTMDTYGHLFPSPEDDQAQFAAGELALVG